MKLFDDFVEPQNILPHDGKAIYFGQVVELDDADRYLRDFLKQVPWNNDQGTMYGEPYVSKRKIAWFGSLNKKQMTLIEDIYDHITIIKTKIGELTHVKFNACLFNLYETGNQGVAWHSDREAQNNTRCNIASFSLGAERRFDFRHRRTHERTSIVLEHGSLLLMTGATQLFWQHQLPKTAKVHSPRINLTFRQIPQTSTTM